MKSKSIMRVAAALLISIVSFGAVSAQAADSWLPRFDSDQHVYIAPAAQGNVRTNFAIGDFKTELADAARQQNLDVYVIVTRSEADAGAVTGSGPVLVRKLWDDWTSTANFSSKRALVILMTGGSDGKLVSVGVRAGETLNSLGIVRNTMSDANGPVIPVLHSYLASNPALVPVKIVHNISAIVAAKSGNVSQTSGPTAPTNSAPRLAGKSQTNNAFGAIIAGLLATVVVIGIVILVTRAKSKSRNSSSGNVFEDRLRSGSSYPSGDSVSRRDRTSGTTPGHDGSSTARDATILGAGALGGYVLGSEVQRRRDEERRRDSGTTPSSTTNNDTPYVPPASSCSTPSTPASSCSTPSSSCGGGGSSCGGGGSSCGGGS